MYEVNFTLTFIVTRKSISYDVHVPPTFPLHTNKFTGRVNSHELSALAETAVVLKNHKCDYSFWLQDSPVLKDCLYPLGSSVKRKKPPTHACATAVNAKKPRYEGAVQSAPTGDASTTENASQAWCLQGTQILRSVASRVRQAIQKHLFKRPSAVPLFR
jgi:hypothetical protein